MVNTHNIKIMKFSIITVALISCFEYSYAQENSNKSGDSVIMPSGASTAPKVSSNGNVTKTSYNYAYSVEEQLSNCPSGYKGSKGSQYISAQRNVTKVYSGATVVNTIYGSWQATDEECAQTQTQTLGCPANYSGSIQQERTVSSSGSTTPWTTTSNGCYYDPPPPPPPPAPVTPPPVTPTPSCTAGTSYDLTPRACPSGQSGSQFFSYTTSCPSGSISSAVFYSTCSPNSTPTPSPVTPPPVTPTPVTPTPTPPPPVVCTPSSWPNIYACPAGQTGSITSTSYHQCPSGPYVAGNDYQGPQTNTCVTPTPTPTPPPPVVCTPSSWPNVYACPAGQTGSITSTSYHQCPSGPYVVGNDYQGPQTNTCVTPTPTPPPPVVCTASNWPNVYACPTGQTGSITSTSYHQCPSGPYVAGNNYEGPRTNTCVTPPPVTPPPVVCTASSWSNTYACPAGQTGSITSTSYHQCPSGPYVAGNSYEGPRSNNCTTPPPSCPEPYKTCFYDGNASGNGDPREMWYVFGQYNFSGPQCLAEFYQHGSRTEYDGGCPAGY